MDKTDVDQFLTAYGVVIHQDNADQFLEHGKTFVSNHPAVKKK